MLNLSAAGRWNSTSVLSTGFAPVPQGGPPFTGGTDAGAAAGTGGVGGVGGGSGHSTAHHILVGAHPAAMSSSVHSAAIDNSTSVHHTGDTRLRLRGPADVPAAAAAVDASMTPGDICLVAVSISLWYTSSMAITAANKIVFDNLGFDYPLLVTAVHFMSMSVLLRLCFLCLPCLVSDMPQVSRSTYVRYIVPISFFTAADITLTNISYPMVSLSVMTVIKSAIVVVTYLLGIVFGLEQFQWKLFGVISLICASISFTVPGMEIRNFAGVACLCAALFAGSFRWVVVHHQLQRHRLHPLQLMMLTQPLATIFLVPFVVWDFHGLIIEWTKVGFDVEKIYAIVVLVSAAVFLAFLLVYSEFDLVRRTSSVTLTVAGTGKEVATILMSAIGFSEIITWKTITGISFSIIGIVIYSRLRYKAQKEKPPPLPDGGATAAESTQPITSPEINNNVPTESPKRRRRRSRVHPTDTTGNEQRAAAGGHPHRTGRGISYEGLSDDENVPPFYDTRVESQNSPNVPVTGTYAGVGSGRTGTDMSSSAEEDIRDLLYGGTGELVYDNLRHDTPPQAQ